MNIAIFGDSFATGETDRYFDLNKNIENKGYHLAHSGLTKYLTVDGNFVINFSKGGNTNSAILNEYHECFRQNPDIKWDMAIVFQTEVIRDDQNWINNLKRGVSVRDVETVQLKELYCDLKKYQDIY